jgi:protein-histidine pros-kinase
MLRAYGSANGFGWQMNETVGAQLVSIPMSLALQNAQRDFHHAVGVLLGVFVGVMTVLNLLLHLIVIRPVTRMAEVATAVSLGKPDAGEFEPRGRDEISLLGQAFARMRRSLDQAMQMLAA